jgi:hypothetical protein
MEIYISNYLNILLRLGLVIMRNYYSKRVKKQKLNIKQLYSKLETLFLYFRDKDYFKEKLFLTYEEYSKHSLYKASLTLNFPVFPIEGWHESLIIEDNIFDAIEFLYDHVSMPEEFDTGWNYQDYISYDEVKGKEEFRNTVNLFLCDYRDGYELSSEGEILSVGDSGLTEILSANIIKFDVDNIDLKVKAAVHKWKNRHLDMDDRRKAIQDIADVFEWLKKSGYLEGVLGKKDERMLFEIANNFAIRHHNPDQKTNYDKTIWYSWMFHFYLATYHAVIRLINKDNKL